MSQLVTADDILSSGNDHPDLAAKATPEQRANAEVLATRSSALLSELGYTKRPGISDGLRAPDAPYGAPKSAHKEGKAVDFIDATCALTSKCTPALLKKHGLRMEHPDETGGKNTPLRADGTHKTPWCHLDTREPYGLIFHP